MATNTFYLRIASAKKIFFSGRCVSIIVPVADGQEEILASAGTAIAGLRGERADFSVSVQPTAGKADL